MRIAKPKRVLFVCIGNSCRSQMAEGFARTYGQDVMTAESAGIAPASAIAQETARAMAEKNIDISGQMPKHLDDFRSSDFDLIVNMSGFSLAGRVTEPMRNWTVRDPVGADYSVHCAVCDQIENLVMNLILEFRRERKK